MKAQKMNRAPENYYAVLGVAPTASQKEIAHAFRALMRTRHPDVDAAATAPTSNEVLGIMRAFSVLKDPRKRAEYDRSGHGRPTGGRPVRPAAEVVPVSDGPLDIPVNRKPAPTPLFRITPVTWEQGPWTGLGKVKRRRTT